MSVADIVIVSIVVAVFIFCVYSMIKSQRSGKCIDCSSHGSCSAATTGHCHNSEELVAKAAKAANSYKSKSQKA